MYMRVKLNFFIPNLNQKRFIHLESIVSQSIFTPSPIWITQKGIIENKKKTINPNFSIRKRIPFVFQMAIRVDDVAKNFAQKGWLVGPGTGIIHR